jgi:hypothetical protein
MPPFLVTWVLGGGWKWIAGGLLLIGLLTAGGIWLHHYHILEEKAAQYDTLKASFEDQNNRLAKAMVTIHDNEIAARQAADDLRVSTADRASLFAALRKGMANAAVATNPVCFPSDDERGVRNKALERYAPGPGGRGAVGGVPAVP